MALRDAGCVRLFRDARSAGRNVERPTERAGSAGETLAAVRVAVAWEIVNRVSQYQAIGLSTLAYGVIVVAASRTLLGAGGHGEEGRQRMVAEALDWPGGQWLVGGAAAFLASAAVYQLKYVYDRDHLRRIELRRLAPVAQMAVNMLGWAGYGARCAILLVLSWFLLRAAWSFDPQAMGDTDSAFDFLGLGGGPLGDAVFSAVSLGTIAYGIFLYVNGAFFQFKAPARAEPSA